MRASVAADHAVRRARRSRSTEGRALEEPRASRSRWRSSTTSRARREESGDAAAADDLLRARPVRGPVQGPARRVDGPDRPVQAARRRRRVLARRREAPDAPADLRDGLGDPGGAGPVPRGGARRRRSATTASWACSSTCSRSTTSRPGSAFWHPKGQRIWRTLETRDARAPGPARLPGGLDADPRVRAPVAPVGPLGPLRRQHVHRRGRGPEVLASSR